MASLKDHMYKRAAMQNGPGPKVNSDSLMNESYRKKQFAKEQEGMAKGQIKRDGGNVSQVSFTTFGKPINIPSGNERMKIVKNLRASATKDSIAANKKR